MLTFSDQQIITGIALLTSGFSQLRSGLAVYYWQLTVDLAWFSSITHLTTLTCLRYYFQERQGLKVLRLMCIAVTAGMLGCALASTGSLGAYYFTPDYPAWCLFHRKLLMTASDEELSGPAPAWYYNTYYVALVLLFLFVSYGARVIQLFPFGLDKLLRNSRTRLRTLMQSRLLKYKESASGNSFGTYWALVYTLTLSMYCILKAAADIYSSMLWEVCSALQIPLHDTHTDYLNHKITWLAVALIWGSIRIVMDRNVNFDGHHGQRPDPGSISGQDVSSAVSEDDVWGFGQVVAVALLLAPLFSFFETIYGRCGASSSATCVWTSGNHTKNLSPIESVIMEKTKYERLPSSGPPDLESPDPVASPGLSDAEPWTDLYEYAWFRSLIWLIYLQSLGIAASILSLCALQDDSYNLGKNIAVTIIVYLFWIGFDLAMLLLFTVVSLSLCHSKDTSGLRWTWRAKLRANRRRSKWIRSTQRIVLNVSILVLTTASGFFGWVILVFGVMAL